jgi:putative ABC transport system permease protein
MDELISAIRAIPGISSATYSSTGLMDIMTCRYRINNGSARCACLSVVDPGYFATVKASLVKGGGFTARRDSHAPIISAIVDEAFVRAELQNQNPIGSKLSLEIAGEQLPIEIIGVTQHLNQYGMDRPEFIHPQIYLPLQQIPSSLAPIVLSQMKLFIRTDKSFAELRPAVKGVVQQFDRGQSVTLAKSIDMLLRLYGGHRLFSLGSFFIFATVSLLLVIVSIRSLIAYTIDERSHEIAIRIALGARRMELYQLVASKALRLIVIGGAIGVGATLLLRQFVYRYQEGENWDPQGIALVLALFALVAFASCYVSARRATLLDPNQLLRTN